MNVVVVEVLSCKTRKHEKTRQEKVANPAEREIGRQAVGPLLPYADFT